MIIFFLVLNGILLLAAFFFIILLYMRQNRYRNIEKELERKEKEFEDAVSSFFLMMKEENEQFLKRLETGDVKSSGTSRGEFAEREENTGIPAAIARQADDLPASEEENGEYLMEESGENSTDAAHQYAMLVDEVERLLSEGLSAEEIAKRLGKGKTEIGLLIKFTPRLQKLEKADVGERKE